MKQSPGQPVHPGCAPNLCGFGTETSELSLTNYFSLVVVDGTDPKIIRYMDLLSLQEFAGGEVHKCRNYASLPLCHPELSFTFLLDIIYRYLLWNTLLGNLVAPDKDNIQFVSQIILTCDSFHILFS